MSTADKVLDALRAYDLKPSGANQWRSNSPLRPGSNSHGFTLTVEGGEYGAFDDKVSGDSGSLYELAERLGIETPKGLRAAVANTKRAYSGIDDYAAAHGLTADEMRAAGWEVVTHKGRAALAFKTDSGTRWRFIDGGDPPYINPLEYKACWYGLKRAITMAAKTNGALVICNGEISTVAAQKYGIPACCKTGGETALPKPLLDELKAKWQGAIWLAFDCDETGRKAAAGIVAQLPAAVAIDLGLGEKGDLADYVMLHTDDAAHGLGVLAVRAPKLDEQLTDMEALIKEVGNLTRALRKDEQDHIDPVTALSQARAQLDRVSLKLSKPLVKTFADLARERCAEATERAQNAEANGGVSLYEVEGLRMNIPAFDNILHGFRPEIYDVYGATGSGKTFMLVSMAREFLKQAPGFIVSTELQPGRWFDRLIASMAEVSASDIRRGVYGDKGAWQRVQDAYALLGSMRCEILDTSSPTPEMIRAAFLRGMDAGNGYEWLIVDSQSKMSYPGATAIYDRMSGVSNGLQDLMRETDVPIIASNQIGRDLASRPAGQKQPQLEDGYGGGIIEHNAGAVIGLYNHAYYVKRGLESVSDLYPDGMVLARFLKIRDEDDSDAPVVKLQLRPGIGFYEWKATTRSYDDITESGLRVD